MQLTPPPGMLALRVLAVLALPTVLSADEVEVHGRLAIYQDDDATTVASPRTRVLARPADDWTIAAGWAADVTTSASVDITTSATRGWRETRNEVFGSVGTVQGSTSARVGVVYSTEEDWDSLGLGGGAAIDLLQRNVTLSGRYGLSLERVGRADDETFERPLTVHTVELGLAQVLSPEAIGSIAYTVSAAQGALQSSYRYVPIAGGVAVVPESHPTSRLRQAVTLRVNHHVFRDSAVQADYRLYLDDWGVLSHTAGVRTLVHFDPGLTLRVRVRGYLQSSADFYRDDYDQLVTYVSADRELSRILGVLAGLKVAYRVEDVGPFRRLEVDAKVDVFRYAYPEYAELSGRLGLFTEVGLSIGL